MTKKKKEGGACPLSHFLCSVTPKPAHFFCLFSRCFFSLHLCPAFVSIAFVLSHNLMSDLRTHLVHNRCHTGSYILRSCLISLPALCFPAQSFRFQLLHSLCSVYPPIPADCVRNLQQTEVGVLRPSLLGLRLRGFSVSSLLCSTLLV